MSQHPFGLALLLDYESDNDEDSNSENEGEKKRKSKFINENCAKKKCRSELESSNVYAMDTGEQSPHILDANSEDVAFEERKMDRDTIPLPMEFAINQDVKNDPSKHQGRIRTFAHEKGNWASIVYIPLFLGINHPYLTSLVSSLSRTCYDRGIELIASDDFHISLTKTLKLYFHLIPAVTNDLKKIISNFPKFSAWLHGLAVYTNEERTRTFLGVKVVQGKNEMKGLVQEIDDIVELYCQPTFYEDCSFHVTLGWVSGDASSKLKLILSLLEDLCQHYFTLESDMRTFDVDEIHFKTGNKICKLPLKDV